MNILNKISVMQYIPKVILRPLGRATFPHMGGLGGLVLLLMAATFGASAQDCCKTPAQKLAERMANIQKKGYMMGHQDATFYGLTWEWEKNRCDVKETCGDYPAVMGFDLGGIEMDDAKNLDSVPFTRIREELITHHERGGIVTLSWHPRNPLTGGTAWDVSNDQVVRSVLYGGVMHVKFESWLKKVGDFIATLKTSDGKPVPIIFRPWHEQNGSWFWWGEKLCTASEYHGLWNMTQDYLNGRGFTNLLWSYSPNLGVNADAFNARYPGNDRVTLLGLDAYQWGTEEEFISGINADMKYLSQFAKDNGKLFALTETGMKNMPVVDWWTRVLKPQMDKYPICYFLLWRNYKKEYFGPAPSVECAKDFKKLYKAENTLFLKEIK